MIVARSRLSLVLLVLLASTPTLAGPPLITDDPDTPGKGGWEINFSYNLELIREAVVETLPGGRSRERIKLAREHMIPLVDINYGLLENDQWKIEFPALSVQQPD